MNIFGKKRFALRQYIVQFRNRAIYGDVIITASDVEPYDGNFNFYVETDAGDQTVALIPCDLVAYIGMGGRA